MDKGFTKRKDLSEAKHIRIGFIAGAVGVLVSISVIIEMKIYSITDMILPGLVDLGIGNLMTKVYYMMAVRTWVLVVLLGVLAIYIPVRLTQGFIGSRARIEREILEHLSTGNLMHKFKVREKDEMASTATALNRMVGGLCNRVREVEDFRKDVEKDLDQCLASLQQDLSDEKRQQLVSTLNGLVKKNREIPYLVH
ncbi:MAG: hypothetical protein ABH868_04230 [bacterium]